VTLNQGPHFLPGSSTKRAVRWLGELGERRQAFDLSKAVHCIEQFPLGEANLNFLFRGLRLSSDEKFGSDRLSRKATSA